MITFNTITMPQFRKSLDKLAGLQELALTEKRKCVKLLKWIKQELEDYVELENKLLAEHYEGTDDKGNKKYKDIDELNKKLEELRAMQIKEQPELIKINKQAEARLTAMDMFNLAQFISQ